VGFGGSRGVVLQQLSQKRTPLWDVSCRVSCAPHHVVGEGASNFWACFRYYSVDLCEKDNGRANGLAGYGCGQSSME
jgi:hypothetical protein